MVAVPAAIGIAGSIVFLLLLLKLARRSHEGQSELWEPWSDEWFEEFSSFRYLPMRRLLSKEEENAYVARVGTSGLAAFRSERRGVCREYLRMISRDFRRMSEGVRLAVLHSSEDRSTEISRLIHLQLQFRRLLLMAELRLALHWVGVEPVDATTLINALQDFEFTLRELRFGGQAA